MSAIYQPKGKAREYSPLALNYYKGCNHGCLYCYVPGMMKRFNSKYNHEYVDAKPRLEVFKLIERSCKKYQNSNEQVLLNFTSDPYNELELELGQKRGITYYALTQLLKHNIPVSILTKSGRSIERDIDLFHKFGENIIVGQSLTFDNIKDSNKWESNAATPRNRIISLETLQYEGINTWASFEPVIDTKQSLNLLENVCRNNSVNYVKIGKLNNYKGIDKEINWTDFLNESVEICRKFSTQFYIKKDLIKYKDKKLELSESEINQDYLALKNKKMLTNQLF